MPADTTARKHSGAPRRAHGEGFVLDVRSLGRAPGSMRELRRTVTTTERLGLDLAGVSADTEVELDLRLQSVSEECSSPARWTRRYPANAHDASNSSPIRSTFR